LSVATGKNAKSGSVRNMIKATSVAFVVSGFRKQPTGDHAGPTGQPWRI